MEGALPSGDADAPSAEVRLLFDCLLNEDETRALAIHDRLRGYRPGLDLADHLSGRDLEDCLFLLAEAYDRASRRGDALLHYEAVLDLEGARCPAPFFEYIQGRIRGLRRGGTSPG